VAVLRGGPSRLWRWVRRCGRGWVRLQLADKILAKDTVLDTCSRDVNFQLLVFYLKFLNMSFEVANSILKLDRMVHFTFSIGALAGSTINSP
jgi:hypothetical protein